MFAVGTPGTRRANSSIDPWKRLRTPRKLGKIGRSLFQISVATLLPFFTHVEEHRRIPREFLQTRLAIAVRIECRFQTADCNRTVAENFEGPLCAGGLEFVDRHDRVDEPHIEGLLGIVCRHKYQISRAFFCPTIRAR